MDQNNQDLHKNSTILILVQGTLCIFLEKLYQKNPYHS